MPFKPEEFPVFTNIDNDFINDKLKMTTERMKLVFPQVAIKNIKKTTFDRNIMIEIIYRIEKRRVYFHVFHNRTKMGELNEAALFTFWIMKLMPFRNSDKNIPTVTLNLKMAHAILQGAVAYVAKKENKQFNFNKKLDRNLLYALKYRDLSKEAIMAIAESLII